VTTRDLDRQIAAANPLAPDRVAALALPPLEPETLRERGPELPVVAPASPRRRRGPAFAFAALAAAGALAALLVLSTGGDVATKRQPEFAAAAVRVAEANPRLLVTAPGWSVKHAYGFEADSGTMIFVKEGWGFDRAFQLNWYPARFYGSFLRDRNDVGPRVKGELLGFETTTVHNPRNTKGADYATLFSPEGKVAVEVHAVLDDRRQYEEVLHSLRRVDVDTWLRAMPLEVVRPAALSATVEEMLRGIPLPPDFDRGSLPGGELLSDPYRLGTKVTGAVACSWLERWSQARRAGDTDVAREAVAAMRTAPTWPVLAQMAREGGWKGDGLPPHGQGWSSQILAASREIAAGHLKDAPAYYGTGAYRHSYAFGTTGLGCRWRN
jgi:hypothetical protein